MSSRAQLVKLNTPEHLSTPFRSDAQCLVTTVSCDVTCSAWSSAETDFHDKGCQKNTAELSVQQSQKIPAFKFSESNPHALVTDKFSRVAADKDLQCELIYEKFDKNGHRIGEPSFFFYVFSRIGRRISSVINFLFFPCGHGNYCWEGCVQVVFVELCVRAVGNSIPHPWPWSSLALPATTPTHEVFPPANFVCMPIRS